MGLLRKLISGSAAVATGGISLGVVQFRSDTERSTRELKLQRLQDRQQHEELKAMYADEAAAIEAERASASISFEARRHQATTSLRPADTDHQQEKSIADRLGDLERLVALRDSGVLSQVEYEQEKQAILREI
jgi:hypothetical protein